MSESVSRYGIVSDLTTKKLQIMDKKLELEDEIETKSLDIDRKEHELGTWKSSISEQIKREESEKVQDIAFLKKEHDHLVLIKKEKEKSFDKKLFELDKALKSIQDISKSAAAQAEK